MDLRPRLRAFVAAAILYVPLVGPREYELRRLRERIKGLRDENDGLYTSVLRARDERDVEEARNVALAGLNADLQRLADARETRIADLEAERDTLVKQLDEARETAVDAIEALKAVKAQPPAPPAAPPDEPKPPVAKVAAARKTAKKRGR